MLIQWKNNNKGVSIVEILVVSAIIGTAFVSLLGLAALSLKSSTLIKETTQAENIAKETIEAVRNLRDGTTWGTDGLGTLTPGISYYPEIDITEWTLAQGEETINGFTRKVVFEKVSRDPGTKNIEATYNPVNDDPNTRKVTVTVFWKSRKVEIITYLTNWK